MHIATTALLAISFYILGRPSTVHALAPYDDFGANEYNFKCPDNKFYSKLKVYGLANHYCNTIKEKSWLRDRPYEKIGYRNKYPELTNGDDKGYLNSDIHIVPIRREGLFRFEFDQNEDRITDLNGAWAKIDPGRIRLALGNNCLVLGLFYDIDHPEVIDPPNIKWCKIYERSGEEIITPVKKISPYYYPDRSRQRSQRGSLGPSLERILDDLSKRHP